MRELAVITGASAGLGALFARELAARGHDVLLVARRGERLEALAAELAGRHGVTAIPLVADLEDPAAPARIAATLAQRGRPVDLLVNNAGFGLGGEFAGLDRDRQLAIVDVNVRALVDLTHRVLPEMIARRRGAILNVASTAAFQPGPYMAVYYATKAFVLSWSEALHEELKPHGIRVSALCPGPTHTEFGAVAGTQDNALFRWLGTGPERVVRDGLAGVQRNAPVNVSGVVNALLAQGVRFTPRAVVRRVAGALQRSRVR
jgi:short-subunit dehydrogenase